MKDLLTEKYRPDTIENYVFTDENMKSKIMEWISNPHKKRIPFPNILLAGSPGTGKAQGLDNKILTKDGWVRMGDISVGTEVVTPDNKLSKVTGVYPQGKKDLYTVNFIDGRSTQCCKEHVWKVFIDNEWQTKTLEDFMNLHNLDVYVPLVTNVSSYSKDDDRLNSLRSYGHIPKIDGSNLSFLYEDKLKIESIVFYKNDDAQCIMIEDENHLYITDDYIVTHNTTLAKILCNECDVEKGDILYINASRENNVDTVRNKIHDFCSTMPMGNFKVVILDEADLVSEAGQKILRAEMEVYSDEVRFIATCNIKRKIMDALQSRFQVFDFEKMDIEQYFSKLIHILDNEGIEYDPDNVANIVSKRYPDLRKGINELDKFSVNKKLMPYESDDDNSGDLFEEAAKLFKEGDYLKARSFVCNNISENDYESFYRFMYNNLDIFSNDVDVQFQCIIPIAKGLQQHSSAADVEINLANTFVEINNVVNNG